ncbi:MAG: lytic transglycosylase domain-containing protein [Gammaproteobacteria bacterium]
MLNNINKTCLMILMLTFCANLQAQFNITINVNGQESYSSHKGVSDKSAVSIGNDGSISVSYNNPSAKAVKKPASKSKKSSASGSDDGIIRANRKKSLSRKNKEYAAMVAQAAKKHQVDAKLLHAVIQAESSYNPTAVSPAGAVGLMQLMPATASRFGVYDRTDPYQNIDGGTRYLKHLLTMFDSNLPLAVAAYNAGENAVIRNHNTIPPYRETRNYVKDVLYLKENMKRSGNGYVYDAPRGVFSSSVWGPSNSISVINYPWNAPGQ